MKYAEIIHHSPNDVKPGSVGVYFVVLVDALASLTCLWTYFGIETQSQMMMRIGLSIIGYWGAGALQSQASDHTGWAFLLIGVLYAGTAIGFLRRSRLAWLVQIVFLVPTYMSCPFGTILAVVAGKIIFAREMIRFFWS